MCMFLISRRPIYVCYRGIYRIQVFPGRGSFAILATMKLKSINPLLPERNVYYMSRVVGGPDFYICEKKTQISFAVAAKLIGAFVFATRIVQSLYYLSPKFQASGLLLWLCEPVCVGPGRGPEDRFSQDEAHVYMMYLKS